MSSKRMYIDAIKARVSNLYHFIKQHEFLANAHATEFITHDHWNNLIPREIQMELLALTDDELRILPMVNEFLEKRKTFAGNNFEEVADEDALKPGNMTTGKPANEDSLESEDKASSRISREYPGCYVEDPKKDSNEGTFTTDNDKSPSSQANPVCNSVGQAVQVNDSSGHHKHFWHHKTLRDFLTSVERHKLEDLDILTPVEKFETKLDILDLAPDHSDRDLGSGNSSEKRERDNEASAVSAAVDESLSQLNILDTNYAGRQNERDSLNSKGHEGETSDVSTPMEESLSQLNILDTNHSGRQNERDSSNIKKPEGENKFMNQKKSHEIEVMTKMCGGLHRAFQIDLVIDIGSGKGYLGTSLAAVHNIVVVGVDSSHGNTEGAQKRSKLMQKQKKGFRKQEQLNSNHREQRKVMNESLDIGHKESELQHQLVPGTLAASSRNDGDLTDVPKSVSVHKIPENCKQKYVPSGKETKEKSANNINYFPETVYIDKSTELNDVIRSAVPDDVLSRFGLLDQEQVCETHGKHHLGQDKLHRKDDHFKDTKILLTGLHTCGDLASNIIRIFLKDRSVRVLCYVGCCYHLLTEKFQPSSPGVPDATEEYGFPLSSTLMTEECFLGRTALNLAAQSPYRIKKDNSDLQGRTFFKRALLEKIICDLFGSDMEVKGLRNVDKKCATFSDYVRKAFGKLGLPADALSEELLSEYLEKYKEEENHLVAFFQLRASLAPCVEALILLDRLLFLLEQDSVEDVFLVRMFDPEVSPRCYGIVAIK